MLIKSYLMAILLTNTQGSNRELAFNVLGGKMGARIVLYFGE